MLEEKSLKDLHVVITGGGRGIGAAIADAMDSVACKITLMGRSGDSLEQKCKTLSNAQGVTVDVCNEESVHAAFSQAKDAFDPIDILINNAGAAYSSPLHKTDSENWKYMLDVNLTGAFYCCKAVVPDMRKRKWGRIVNIASIAGLYGAPYIAAYCAAKHGVIGLTRALALELASLEITVNALCPGYTNTEMLEGAINNIRSKTKLSREEAEDQLKNTSPQHRFVQPEEVATSVLWLCQPGSESITGQSIPINGGSTQA
jgi:NAD(P)-dependent dehydrogenase (short-subunit alcohol dehydrogenase family)